jgi:hypothetical protein
VRVSDLGDGFDHGHTMFYQAVSVNAAFPEVLERRLDWRAE